MDLGVIKYIADDKSHGYLFKLDDLEVKHVYDVIKRGSKDDSLKFELKGKDLGLQRFQIVGYTETEKAGKRLAKINSPFVTTQVRN